MELFDAAVVFWVQFLFGATTNLMFFCLKCKLLGVNLVSGVRK